MSAFSDENAGIPVSPRKLLSPIQAMGLVLRDSNRANISSFPDHSFSEKTNHDVKLDNSEDDDGVISFKLPSALSDGMELNPFHPRTQIQNPPLTTNQHVQDNMTESTQSRNQHESDLETRSAAVCSQDLRESAQDSNQHKADLKTPSAAVCSQDPEMKGLFEKIELLTLNAINILDGEEYGVSPLLSKDIACGENYQNTNSIESNTHSTGLALVCSSDTLDYISTGGIKFDIDIPQVEKPFITRSQLANTLEKCAPGLDEDPFTTRSQLGNTPTKCVSGLDENPFTTKSQLGNTPTKCAPGLDEDPFTTRSQLGNTPTKCAPGLDENPFTTKSQLANTPGKCAPGLDEDPLTTKSQLGKTPEKSESGLDENPFTTKSQLGKTPEKGATGLDEDPFTTRSQLGNTPTKCAPGLDEDPFTTRSQLGNMPTKCATGLDENPFTAKSQLGKTHEKGATGLDEDPFTTRSQLGKTPEKSESKLDENPFTTKSQLGKTHEKSATGLDEDPFTTRSQLGNTPTKCAPGLDEDPFTTRSQLGNMPTKCATGLDENPFTAKSQLGKTHEKGAKGLDEDPFTTRSQLGKTPEKSESKLDENPFTTKSQLGKTHEKSATGLDEDPFTTRSQLGNTPTKCAPGLDEDPFTTKSQLGNTPTKCAPGLDEDPFTTKSQLGNTPTKSAPGLDEDPFTTKSQLGNTPTKCATGLDENPFTTKSQLGNTPIKCATGLDENPFTTKSQLGNTPTKCATGLDENPFTTKSQLGNTPTKCVSGLNENPFTTKSQLGNTPGKCAPGLDEDPFTTKSQLGNTPTKCALGLDKNPITTRSQREKMPEKCLPGPDENPITRSQHGKTLEMSAPEMQANFVAEKPNLKADQTVADARVICVEAINSQNKFADVLTDISQTVHRTENKSAVKGDDLITSRSRNCTLEGEETNVLPEELPAITVLSSPAKEFELASSEEMEPFKENKMLNLSAAVSTSGGVLNGNNFFLTRPNFTENSVKDKTETKYEKSPNVALQPYEIGDFVAENDREAEQSAVGNKANIETTEHPLEALENTDPNDLKSEWKVFDVLGNGEEFAKALEEHNPLLLASELELGIEENMFLPGTQVFSDPSAWELLEKFGGDAAKESDLRKQSLYVKFDPLVKPLTRSPEKMPAPAHAAPRKVAGRHTEINTSLLNNSSAEESLCLFGTPPRVARRRSILNQRRINASVSQTIAEEEAVKQVDLFFMNGEEDSHQFINDQSHKRLSAVTNLVQVEEIPKFTESEWLRMQQTLKLQYEGLMLSKEREFTSALQEERVKVTTLEEEVQKFKSKNKVLSDSVLSMKTVVAEYEKTLEVLIATKEKTTEEARRKVEALQAEKDQALDDVQAWDKSFSQLHCRYEKMKTVLEGFKKNEETLKTTIKTLRDKLKESEDKTVKVKACAEEKIAEVAKRLEQTKADNVRAEAELKRRQLQVQSLESTLEQKAKENKELTDLCETLINQVGGSRK